MQNTWKLKNSLLNNMWVSEDELSQLDRKKNTSYQNLWDTVKAPLREKSRAPHEQKYQVNDLISPSKINKMEYNWTTYHTNITNPEQTELSIHKH